MNSARKLLALLANPVAHALVVHLTSAEVAEIIQLALLVLVAFGENTTSEG